jgi:hypothetical protein
MKTEDDDKTKGPTSKQDEGLGGGSTLGDDANKAETGKIDGGGSDKDAGTTVEDNGKPAYAGADKQD